MFNSTILDVAIGLVFCFASVALLVSAMNEAIASLLKFRNKTLLSGIKQLLNEPNGSDLVLKLYNHALINPLSSGTANSTGAKPPGGALSLPTKIPAYIPSTDFASALVDIIQVVPGDFAALDKDVARIADPQIRQLLQGFLARAKGDVDAFQSRIADWFDNAMDRLSGSYKRRAQLVTFLLGFVTAAAFNIDSFYVLSQLWARPSLAAAIASPGTSAMIARAASSPLLRTEPLPSAAPAASNASTGQSPSEAASAASDGLELSEWLLTLRTLPVGWDNNRVWPRAGQAHTGALLLYYAMFLVGLAVTASAAVFGAPFWCDLLQRLIQVRGTGAKPPTNRDNKASAANGAGSS
jgi:hypothetical protein